MLQLLFKCQPPHRPCKFKRMLKDKLKVEPKATRNKAKDTASLWGHTLLQQDADSGKNTATKTIAINACRCEKPARIKIWCR